MREVKEEGPRAAGATDQKCTKPAPPVPALVGIKTTVEKNVSIEVYVFISFPLSYLIDKQHRRSHDVDIDHTSEEKIIYNNIRREMNIEEKIYFLKIN